MISFATFACSIMIFAMIGLKSVASVVIIAILFGFFAGVYIALMAPLMVVLTEDLYIHCRARIRMGIAFAFSGTSSF